MLDIRCFYYHLREECAADKRLEKAGIHTLNDLSKLKLADIVELGVRSDLAKQIVIYVRRRLM